MKWVSSSITKSLELSEIDLNTVEMLISEVCTHLIAAGVMKQIVDFGEKNKDVFCVSVSFTAFVLILSANLGSFFSQTKCISGRTLN